MTSRFAVLLAGLLVVAAAGCSKGEATETRPSTLKADAKGVDLTPDAPQWKYVELKVAEEGPPLVPLPAPGRVDFDEKRTSNVGSPLAGRIEAVQVRLGDTVKQGDKLFSVRSGAWADLDREAETARSQVGLKKRVLERSKELYELKAIAEKDVIAAEAELKEAELALKAAEAKKQSLQVVPGGDNLFFVRAPRGGTVVEHDLYSSQEVTPDREKPLLRISDLDEVLVLADVPENDVSDLATGEPVTIRSQVGGVERKGTVDHISEVVDARRRTVEVRVRAQNLDRVLRPNAFVEVVPAPVDSTRRVKIPDQAVVSEGTRSVVFVARGPGRLEPVDVVPGRRRDGEVEIRGGLAAGTRFVSKGALLLLNQVDLAD
jgi:cobalt-zinc-cadmium efflux system membrane fusion protein